MARAGDHEEEPDLGPAGWSWLIASAVVVGVLTGMLGTAFRLCLQAAEHARGGLIASARGWPVGWIVVMAAVALAAGLAEWMVRRFAPAASGSGIPHVVAVLRGEMPPAYGGVIPVKFFGGLLAIGGGLALGREGPTVQMGATLGWIMAGRVRAVREAWPALLAAGGGAGLATAFNAPVGGMLFVFEEILRRFEPRTVMATAAACIAAVMLQRAVLGLERDFVMAIPPPPPVTSLVLYLITGIVAGFLGALYNRAITACARVAERLDRWPAGTKGLLVGAGVGALAWFMPEAVGGGDDITQDVLAGQAAIGALPLLALVRFVLGPVSYGAGTPGGLFAPLLVLGAQIGLACGWLFHQWGSSLAPWPVTFAVAGMAAFFTATVRSKLTGIILVAEMTWSVSVVFPMLVASAGAYAVSVLLRNAPIYDTLRERQVTRANAAVVHPHRTVRPG
jgi:CIC family chloride channel protein